MKTFYSNQWRILCLALGLLLLTSCLPVRQKKSYNREAKRSNGTTQCCWCVLQDGENEISPYLSEALCHSKFQSGPYKNCGLVEIKERTCDFFSLSGDGAHCQKRVLTYQDKDQIKKIRPPSFIPKICRDRSRGDMDEEEESQNYAGSENQTPSPSHSASAETSTSKQKNYCQCMEDPTSTGHCILVKTDGSGERTILSSRPKRAFQNSCTKEACNSIFDAATFSETCRNRP